MLSPDSGGILIVRPGEIDLHFERPSSPQAWSLSSVEYWTWLHRFPTLERETVEPLLVPAVGAYLGMLMVRHLGGRWVPRRNLDEAQVLLGDRAWLPFLRARHYLQSNDSLLDYSLNRFYRTAERHLLAPKQT